jgi:hypothetical protein
VLPKSSSNIFLKNIGLQPTSPKKPPSAKEKAVQEQLATEKQAFVVLQEEVNVLKQNAQTIEEALSEDPNGAARVQEGDGGEQEGGGGEQSVA